MNIKVTSRRISRRDFLKVGGVGGLALLAGRALPALAQRLNEPGLAPAISPPSAPLASPPQVNIHLAATDGYISLSGRSNPLYVFGFVNVPVGVAPDALVDYKGNVQLSAPILGVDQEADVYLTLTNIGLVVRPDLDDSHTVHWHGFPNATAIFDGVPEVSIAVPVGRDFPYYYKPHRSGTFMYHCHFEDVEHVQMGMTGIVYVRPSQNGDTSLYPSGRYAYNDGDGSTGYDREFALLLNEIWTTPHDNLESIQETIWPDYKANYWTINGRSYPDTLMPNNDPSLPAQPISSLIQVNAGERVLLRFANLGYEQQAMQLPGIPLKVVGEDATLLRKGSVDLSYMTNTIYIGPGEARDVLFTAPAYSGGGYATYLLKNRNVHRLTNDGASELGGQVTEVRVYPAGTLGAQTHPNQTYPESDPTPPFLNPWVV
jgi:FtsP/CotA-like multicopper oxidase with cupredoxin domain